MNMTIKSKKKNKSKKDEFTVEDLVWVVTQIYPNTHGIVIFGDNGVDIIAETKEFREMIESKLEGRITMAKEGNYTGYYQ